MGMYLVFPRPPLYPGFGPHVPKEPGAALLSQRGRALFSQRGPATYPLSEGGSSLVECQFWAWMQGWAWNDLAQHCDFHG